MSVRQRYLMPVKVVSFDPDGAFQGHGRAALVDKTGLCLDLRTVAKELNQSPTFLTPSGMIWAAAFVAQMGRGAEAQDAANWADRLVELALKARPTLARKRPKQLDSRSMDKTKKPPAACTVPGCSSPAAFQKTTSPLCSAHYFRARRGSPLGSQVGRPEPREHRVYLRLDTDTMTRLQALAKKQNKAVAELIFDLLTAP